MNWFERWFMRRIIARQVVQGYDHKRNITGLYRMVYDACRREFFEDNDPTLNAFLQECFDESLPSEKQNQ